MHCPKDISPRDFKALLDEAGKDVEIESSERIGTTRYFRFSAKRQNGGLHRGDSVEYSLECKPSKARRY